MASIKSIIKDMNMGKIPKNTKDLHVDGNDVISAIGKEGPEVGFILRKFIVDALMDRFNWKEEEASLGHLARLVLDTIP
jgi:hypothetical protein